MTVTVDGVLAAGSWSDLQLPRTRAGLRAGSLVVHPDVCDDPRAGAAFVRLNELYAAFDDFELRLATAIRRDSGVLTWKPRSGFEDLVAVARQAMSDIAKAHRGGPQFATWTIPEVPAPISAELMVGYTRLSREATNLSRLSQASELSRLNRAHRDDSDERWWFLSAFGRLDARTCVWVAKRLAAAITVADQSGWVHGDIHSGTVVVDPAHHGLRLDGWWTATRVGTPIAVAPTAPTPPRWIGGAAATAELGVSQAAALLLGECDVDGPLRDVLARHVLRPGRPDELYADVDAAAHKMFGSPAWHELAEPTTDPI